MLITIVVLLCAGAVIAACIIYQLLVQNGKLTLRLDRLERRLQSQGLLIPDESGISTGLPVGSVLHDFELPLLEGGNMTLSHWRGCKVLLIFISPSCNFSRELLADLAEIPAADAGDPQLVIITTGTEDENRPVFAEYELPHPVLLQRSTEVSSLYQVNTTPAGYLVDENGATASVLYTGAAALLSAARRTGTMKAARARRGFSRSLTQSKLLRDGLKAGTRAPDFKLPRLDGAELALESYRGRKVLLVFSDPQCEPCSRLAPRLEKLHGSSHDFQVLMISRGDAEANRRKVAELKLTFPVVLQRHWEISRDYGIFATPVAFLIDERSFLAADAAVGAEAILKLAEEAGERLKRQPMMAAR